MHADLDQAPELGPLGVGGLLDAGFDVLRGHFLACAGTCALLWLPVRAMQPFVGAHALLGGTSIDWGRLSLFLLTATLLPVVIQTVGAGLVTTLVYGHMVGRSVGVGEAFAVAGRKGAALLLVGLLTGTVVASGAGMLAILGFLCPPLFLAAGAFVIVASWRLWLAPAALVLEPSPGAARIEGRRAATFIGRVGQWIAVTLEDVVASFVRSVRLTPGSFGRWLGVWVMMTVILSFFQAPTALTDQPELRRLLLDSINVPAALFDLFSALSTSLFLGVVTAFSAIVITLFYLDARIRREGLDLAMRLERLRLRAEAGTEVTFP
ncbi:MAG: hypothetical protein CMJ84_12470 [Planctomycetes bacterium]|jgi:hypothetical protein|nr:hypothetical protein [Planctomycetota bacterium]